jgi:BolA protein
MYYTQQQSWPAGGEIHKFSMRATSRVLLAAVKTMSEVPFMKPIETSIRAKLAASLNPTYFDVINESYKHNVPSGSESHFNVTVVSDLFEGKSLIQRHRMVNHALGDELKNSVHALSIQARTPAQWSENATANKTPNCLGGDK